MSVTISDGARQGAAVPTHVPASAPQPAPTSPHPQGDDPNSREPSGRVRDDDDAALVAARQAVAEEEGAATGAGSSTPQRPSGQAPNTPAAHGAPSQPGPVPYARFAEVNQTVHQLAADKAALEAELAKLRSTTTTTAPASPPAASPTAAAPDLMARATQIIGAAEAQVFDAAEKYDNGEITYRQMTEAFLRGLSSMLSVREAVLKSQVVGEIGPQAQAATSIGLADQTLLDQQLDHLGAQHTWLSLMSQDQLTALKNMALENARVTGQPIEPNSVIGTARLRAAVGALSDVFGPVWFPGAAKPAPVGTNAPAAQPGPAAGPATSPRSAPQPQQRRAPALPPGAVVNKAAIAGAFPPAQPAAGGAHDAGTISEERLLTMSPEEIEALPPATRARLLAG